MKTALAYAAIALAILALFAGLLAVLKQPAAPKFQECRNALEEATKQLTR